MSNEKNMLKYLAFASALLAALCSCGDTVLEGDGTKAKAIGVAEQLTTNASFTVEAWVKIDADAGKLENVVWAQYTGGTAGRCDLFINNGRLGIFIGSNTNSVGSMATSETLYATSTIPYGEWVHVAFSRDWDTCAYAFYVNGTDSGTGTSKGSMLHVRNMTVGGLYAHVSENAGKNIVKGRLAEVRVWKRVRTAEEIVADMNRRLTGGETGLVAYLPLSETAGNTTENYVSRERCVLSDNWESVDDAELSLTPAVRAPARAYVLTPSVLGDTTSLTPDVRLEGRAFTIEGWIYLPSLRNGRNDIAYQYPGSGRFSLEIDKNTSKLSCWFNGRNLKSSDLNVGEWTHFALVRSGASAQFYINGEADTSTNGFHNIDVADAPFTLFRLVSGQPPGTAFAGRLTEVRIWRTARTQEEIRASQMCRLAGPHEGLLGCWPLTEGAGTRILNQATGVFSSLSNATEKVWDIGTMPVLEDPQTETETCAALSGSACTGGGNGNASISGRDFTLEAWVCPRMYRSTEIHHGSVDQILRQYASSSAGRMIFGIYKGKISLFVGADGWMTGDSCVPLGRWSHIAVVRENDKVRFYLNGEPDGELEGKTTEPPPSANLTLGINTTENFDGALREMRVWDGVRSAQEIQANYRWMLRGTEEGLVAYWPMVTHDGDTLVNMKRGSSNGSLVAAWYPVAPLQLNGKLPPPGLMIIIQ